MTRNIDRLWLLGGVVAMILLVAGSWFLLISPKNTEAAEVRDQAAEASSQLIALKRQVAQLKEESAKLPAYTIQLEANRRALPTTSGVPDFLRQLQDSGTAVNVEISNISVSGPELSKVVATVYQLPISLSAVGSTANMSKFLNRLQDVQPRAVMLSSVALTTTAMPGGSTVQTASISLKAFVAPPVGAGAPTVTTK